MIEKLKIGIIGEKSFIGNSLHADLRDLFDFQTVLIEVERGQNKFDFIDSSFHILINCIGSANVGFSYENPACDLESNFIMVRNILEYLRENNLFHIKFINLSSAAVYGNPSVMPVTEKSSLYPISPYGYHKFMSEILLKEYHHCFKLNTLSLRIFSAYGNGQEKLLLWDLHRKIQHTTGSVILYGTGRESRDFIHVTDIAQQIALGINNADFKGESINVANGKEVRISEVVELYRNHYPKNFEYEFNGVVRPGDPLNWCADVSIMKSWGYMQSVHMSLGIENYIKNIFCD
jgi:UDP-glucose 4-epimerase